MRAVIIGRSQEVTRRALARGVVIPLRSVTGDAQPAIGHELRNRRFAMAGVTGHVRIDRVAMRGLDIRAAVTARAIPSSAVMIVVARSACLD